MAIRSTPGKFGPSMIPDRDCTSVARLSHADLYGEFRKTTRKSWFNRVLEDQAVNIEPVVDDRVQLNH